MLKDERQPDMSRFSSKALKPFGNFEGMCNIPKSLPRQMEPMTDRGTGKNNCPVGSE